MAPPCYQYDGDLAVHYPDEMSVREARQLYFEANGLSDDYEARWVKLKAGPIPIVFPNTQARIRAVKLHDLHHVATEYATSWRGEAEIGAWELAAGCGRHVPAWILNALAMTIGLFIAPRRTLRAFRRGRQCRSLLRGEFRDDYLKLTVGELRAKLGLPSGALEPPNAPRESQDP